jgi:hypothetical protein
MAGRRFVLLCGPPRTRDRPPVHRLPAPRTRLDLQYRESAYGEYRHGHQHDPAERRAALTLIAGRQPSRCHRLHLPCSCVTGAAAATVKKAVISDNRGHWSLTRTTGDGLEVVRSPQTA